MIDFVPEGKDFFLVTSSESTIAIRRKICKNVLKIGCTYTLRGWEAWPSLGNASPRNYCSEKPPIAKVVIIRITRHNSEHLLVICKMFTVTSHMWLVIICYVLRLVIISNYYDL